MRHALVAVAVVLLVSAVALAEIPQVMGYQGRITDNSGIPVDDDTYTMRFRICTAPTGGTVVWDSGDMSVATSGGVFSVNLGEVPQPTLDIAFDQDYWMLVSFEGENQTPRKRFGSVGYAYMASGVVPGTEVAGDFYVAGKLGVGTTSPEVGMDVAGSVNTDSLYRIEGDVVLAVPGSVTRVGRGAGANSTSSSGTFVGFDAGRNNSTGVWNTLIGDSAGCNSTTGLMNTFLGHCAGLTNTTGGSNTYVGAAAGYNNSSGYNNIFVGTQAGYGNDTGYANVAIGTYAGRSNTTGHGNTFVGERVGFSNTTAYHNTFVGTGAGYSNTTGYFNTFLGSATGYNADTGNFNTFVGSGVGYNTTGDHNTFVGQWAGLSNTTGARNTFFGKEAGRNTTTGDGSVFVGYRAGYSETSSNRLYIDNWGAGPSGALIYGEFDNGLLALNANVGIGTTTPSVKLDVAGSVNTDSLYRIEGDIVLAAPGSETRVGRGAGANSTASSGTFVGFDAGLSNSGGTANTFLGHWTGRSNTSGFQNTFLGHRAGTSNTTGYDNTFVGREAGSDNTAGWGNTFVGDLAGADCATGFENTFLGMSAGDKSSSGSENTFLGMSAGYDNHTGSSNTAVGYKAGYNSDGDSCVFVGCRAGYYESGSNKLYIANAEGTPHEALIYGEFDNDILAFNAKVGMGLPGTSPDGRLHLGALNGYPTVLLDRAAAQPTIRSTGSYLIIDSNGSAAALNWYSSDDVILGKGGGNVGVGLTDPNRRLYVRHDVNGLSYPLKVENKHTVPDTAAVGILFSTGGSGSNDRGKGALAYEYKSTWNRGSFHILQDSGANPDNPNLADAVVTVDNDGDVGIGTTNPARRLHVSDVMRLQPRSSAPGSPSMGDMYMDSSTGKLMVYDGSNWQACW